MRLTTSDWFVRSGCSYILCEAYVAFVEEERGMLANKYFQNDLCDIV